MDNNELETMIENVLAGLEDYFPEIDDPEPLLALVLCKNSVHMAILNAAERIVKEEKYQ